VEHFAGHQDSFTAESHLGANWNVLDT
jgi:hypothetical protein